VQRRTTEIGVPRMPDEEIVEIFQNGFRLLKLKAEKEALRNLVFYCDGFPYFAHLLGLAVTRNAARRDDAIIDKETVLAALARAAKDVSASFPKRINLAFEAGGTVQPRKSILRALCLSSEREWRSADVVEAYGHVFGKPRDAGFLHAALGELVKPSRGSVLARSGKEKHYVYRFSDPYLRPYLRMVHFTEPFQTRLF
jgi:hypothetical protein